MRSFLTAVLVFITVLLVIFGMTYCSYKTYEFFAPRYTAVDSKVYKESVQYNEGMIRDLENLKMQYIQADEAGKQALKPIIIHRFSVYDENRLPDDLHNFYHSIQGI